MDAKHESLTELYSQISQLVKNGDISAIPIETLRRGDEFLPKEGKLWDFKEAVGDTKESHAKTVLQIVSFYNSFGGYLVYGVQETQKDSQFLPCGFDVSKFDVSSIRNLIKQYTGTTIDISFGIHDIEFGCKSFGVGLLHIPKRGETDEIVHFLKDGPMKGNKSIFQKDDTYFREQDECVQAKNPGHFQFLFSARNLTEQAKQFSIDHNLPSRDLICPKFIGRSSVLTQLWKWLGDEFEYTRVLSGEGGKGKTSIAYEFSRQLVSNAPKPFERLLWLSLKEKQFSPIEGRYVQLQESDFTDHETFLACLSDNFALIDEEVGELSIQGIKKQLRANMRSIPSIIVVDNIDSLDDEEQRKVIDTCRQLGSSEIRFLITTRNRHGYSSELMIHVPGLEQPEHKELIEELVIRHGLSLSLNKGLYKKLHRDTDGSPLLTESVLRLTKFKSIDEALTEWKGQSGEDARDAALKKELTSLSVEAKRCLLVLHFLKSSSYTELKNIVKLGDVKLQNAIEELQSLFIINEPQMIESEKRYSISNTTALIVHSRPEDFALDYKKLKKEVDKTTSSQGGGKKGNTRQIGKAINQALALINDNRIDEARRTVEVQLQHYKDNPDLLLMLARCLISYPVGKFDEARDIVKNSVRRGQRKELAFDLWYQCERELGNPLGLIECAGTAIEKNHEKHDKWYEILAKATLTRAQSRNSIKVDDLLDASIAMSKSVKRSQESYKEDRRQLLESMNDRIWHLLETQTEHDWLFASDIMREIYLRGDKRRCNIDRAILSLEEAKEELKWDGKKSLAFNICLRKLEDLLNENNVYNLYHAKLKDLG
ncbi:MULTISPECIES: RNA-binding domain-containing protein [unclassified Idiomarina]|uniref:RNA-binding domain-containing protein n=1 Tax=unclassified Idiomarina TaxID=2614829 RepID=UPI00257C0F03|nr:MULTISPECIES: RNA-binding domain-containing protein [unclassified Idiomarina]|tara:strand:+ start:9155 stop:11632 length:2478 start_codon:yes stop_codon:yes gene_type:complete